MPTSEPTLYEVLGVAPDAEPAEIKAAFRKASAEDAPGCGRGGDDLFLPPAPACSRGAL